MSNLSKETIEKFKDIFEKEKGEEISWGEADDGANNLLNFFNTLYDIAKQEQAWKKRLEKEPKGFCLDGNGRTCFICGDSIPDKQAWYDKYGIKCPLCKKAVSKKLVPATVAKDRNSWYSRYDLESRFNINKKAMTSFIKAGILKPRIIPSNGNTPHAYIFLIKENKDILPPKKLVESQMIKEVRDGQNWYHSEPWYKFVDPYKHLKDYKIMNYLELKR